jgi:hypothetical protein
MEMHGAKRGGKVLPEYSVWIMAKQRCHNPKNRQYKDYGGRGITMCARWRKSFAAFLHDVGPRPHPHLSIERRDNDAGYTPENCYWATRQQQRANQRPRRAYIRKDLTGRQFTRLTVLNPEPKIGYGKTRWRCRCQCGKIVILAVDVLLSENTRSCGCLKADHIHDPRPQYPKHRKPRFLRRSEPRL